MESDLRSNPGESPSDRAPRKSTLPLSAFCRDTNPERGNRNGWETTFKGAADINLENCNKYCISHIVGHEITEVEKPGLSEYLYENRSA
jgi:hypothetical protein